MTDALQIANSFVVEYFERLATDPDKLASFYGPQATLTINDIEMGTTEANAERVPITLSQWAVILQHSKLRIESVHAALLYSGVNVFVTFTAIDELQQQHFQSTVTL
uniref:NTF2 domain-containing protein n=1 Tax=Lygus hesperus TaxID=30085 RepID=A0A146LS11_LYGHE